MTNAASAETGADAPESLLGRDRVTAAVLVVVGLALALRFFDLGLRVAHWQEGRLGWWIQRYAATGVYDGTPALGGALLPLLGRGSLETLGATDLALRAPVALVGGLLPLSALGLRRRLADREVVLLAGLLAVAPLLLYYTRFASVDALTAGLALSTVAAVVAVRDAARPALAVVAVLLGVLTVGADPAAALGHLLSLLAAWAVALVLITPDTERGTDAGRLVPAPVRDALASAAPVASGVGLLVGVVVLDPTVPGHLIGAVGDPAGLLEVIVGPLTALGAHLGHVGRELIEPPGPLASAGGLLGTLAVAAPVLTGLALVGGLAEYWTDRPIRPLVAVGLTWAGLSVPLQLVVSGAGHPWVGTHVLVGLVVPAAVGVAATLRWTREALGAGDPLTGAAGGLALIFAAGLVLASVATGVYLSPTAPASAPVQYGQPGQDLRPAVDALDTGALGVGTDVVLYGRHFVDGGTTGLPPACARWYNALPLQWYSARSGATTTCTTNVTALGDLLSQSPTLVLGRDGAMASAGIDPPDYTRVTTRFRAWNANVTVFVRTSGA